MAPTQLQAASRLGSVGALMGAGEWASAAKDK